MNAKRILFVDQYQRAVGRIYPCVEVRSFYSSLERCATSQSSILICGVNPGGNGLVDPHFPPTPDKAGWSAYLDEGWERPARFGGGWYLKGESPLQVKVQDFFKALGFPDLGEIPALNVCPLPTRQAREISAEQWNGARTALLPLVLESLRPGIILGIGNQEPGGNVRSVWSGFQRVPGVRFTETAKAREIPNAKLAWLDHEGGRTLLVAIRHLSRGWSQEAIRQTARLLRRRFAKEGLLYEARP